MVASLLLPLGGQLSVKVHPVVLLQVCDAYIRRKEDQDRVIGSLLGTLVDGVMEIKGCFVVPHNESTDQVIYLLVKALHEHVCVFARLQMSLLCNAALGGRGHHAS